MDIVVGLEGLISVGKPQKNCFQFLEASLWVGWVNENCVLRSHGTNGVCSSEGLWSAAEVVSKDKPSESCKAWVAYSETSRQHKLPPC